MEQTVPYMNLSIVETVFEQLPGFAYWRDLDNHFLGGNQAVVTLAGLPNKQKLEGLSNYNAPWADFAESYKQQDQDAAKGLIYMQLDPVLSANGFCVLTATKKPLYDAHQKVIGVIGLGIELKGSEILAICHLIDSTSPFKGKKSIVISTNNYLKEKIGQSLTPREAECLFYLTRGKSYKRIAQILHLSPRTIEEYMEALKMKLDCHSKDALLETVDQKGLMRFIPPTLLNGKLWQSLKED